MSAGAREGEPLEMSLYVHVPFCASKCAYCDFASAAVDAGDPSVEWTFDAYVAAVERDVARHAAAGLLASVPTVYVGGGTPTLLGSRLAGLVASLAAMVGLAPDAEVTVEANPDSLTVPLAHGLANAGVTRVSLGVQSFDDEVLSVLGRRHDAQSARRAAAAVVEAGLALSVDLMCGVPGLSDEGWRESLREAIATGAEHVSVYPLTIEDGTPLCERVETGAFPEPDSDGAAEQMLTAARVLADAGFERYEVANHARPGARSRHNTRYWTGGAYLGVGPAAASMLPAGAYVDACVPGDAARVRFTASASLSDFLADVPAARTAEFETLTAEEALREDAMLGLRLAEGISADLARCAGVEDVLRELADDGLVECAGDRWRTTERGWLLGNAVYGRVWAGE